MKTRTKTSVLPLATTIALIPIIAAPQRWQGIKAESYFLGSMSSPR